MTPPDTPSRSQQSPPPSDTTSLFLSDDQREKYTSLLRALNGEFSHRFENFNVLENDMLLLFSSPFTFNVDNTPTDLQLELIDLQSDAVIVLNRSPLSLTRF